jgi:hypothetical protein
MSKGGQEQKPFPNKREGAGAYFRDQVLGGMTDLRLGWILEVNSQNSAGGHGRLTDAED